MIIKLCCSETIITRSTAWKLQSKSLKKNTSKDGYLK